MSFTLIKACVMLQSSQIWVQSLAAAVTLVVNPTLISVV